MFTPGQTDYIEELNRMLTAFNAGPYNAVPLTGGVMSGALGNTEYIYSTRGVYARSVDGLAQTILYAPVNNPGNMLESINPAMSLGVTGIAGKAFEGSFIFATRAGRGGSYVKDGFSLYLQARDSSPGGQLSPGLLIVRGNGYVTIPKYVRIGTPEEYDDTYYSVIQNPNQVAGTRNLEIVNSAIFNVGGPGYGSGADCVMRLTQVSSNGRSINAAGTINASGADYAEYMVKASSCGVIAPGQVVGIDSEGKLTDNWEGAISFAVKSTNPCMVGGDIWAAGLGMRPALPERLAPSTRMVVETPATDDAPATYRKEDVPGDTDAEWAAKMAPIEAYNSALEAARRKVDRIAFAGQVPVNVLGAQPGDYIVPVQAGSGIKGIAIRKADITHSQYLDAIGRVIAIEGDGRARVIVKVS
jgi:hypothetical protein